MANDLDQFPLYDILLKNDEKGEPTSFMSEIWSDFLATFLETLRGYLSQNGMFIPPLTVAQRNAIQTPVEGQMIYVSNANTPATPRTAELQIWQVVAGVGQWTKIV